MNVAGTDCIYTFRGDIQNLLLIFFRKINVIWPGVIIDDFDNELVTSDDLPSIAARHWFQLSFLKDSNMLSFLKEYGIAKNKENEGPFLLLSELGLDFYEITLVVPMHPSSDSFSRIINNCLQNAMKANGEYEIVEIV